MNEFDGVSNEELELSELGEDEPMTELRSKVVRAVNANRRAEKRIEAMGVSLNNVGDVAQQFMVEWLVNNILTQDQRDALSLAWAQRYGEILKDMEGKARELRMAHERAKLITPPASPGLIVPGNIRRETR